MSKKQSPTTELFAYSSADGSYHGSNGSIQRWFPSDTEAIFKEHLANPERRQRLEASGWVRKNSDTPTEILYRINQYGFRGDEINVERLEDNCVLFFGCSNMFGIGEFEKNTIPEQFKTIHPELQVVNFGQPGGSLDACTRAAMHWVPRLAPKAICILLPPGVRREFWMEESYDENQCQAGNRFVQFGIRRKIPRNHEIIESIFMTPQEEIVNKQKNLWALTGLANSVGARIIVASPQDCPSEIAQRGHARDLGHFAAPFHHFFAQYFSEMFTRIDEITFNPG